MAKSLGNFFTLRDLLERGYRPRAIRYLLLSVHYRQSLNFTFAGLDQAAASIERLTDFVRRVKELPEGGVADPWLADRSRGAREEFDAALDDDLNTSRALAAVFEWVREANRAMDEGRAGSADRPVLEGMLAAFDAIYDVLSPDPEELRLDAEIETLIEERETARRARDWSRADALRGRLEELGILVEDTPGGPRWKRSSAP